MLRFVIGVMGIAVLLWGATPYAHGQKATEMFIPLGQSPGLSGKVTVIGTIDAVNARDQTITIVGPSATWGAQITDRTKIWLDRSKLRLPNQYGTFADLQKGRMVEVKYEDNRNKGKDKGPAEWVKVQLAEPGAKSGAPGS